MKFCFIYILKKSQIFYESLFVQLRCLIPFLCGLLNRKCSMWSCLVDWLVAQDEQYLLHIAGLLCYSGGHLTESQVKLRVQVRFGTCCFEVRRYCWTCPEGYMLLTNNYSYVSSQWVWMITGRTQFRPARWFWLEMVFSFTKSCWVIILHLSHGMFCSFPPSFFCLDTGSSFEWPQKCLASTLAHLHPSSSAFSSCVDWVEHWRCCLSSALCPEIYKLLTYCVSYLTY